MKAVLKEKIFDHFLLNANENQQQFVMVIEEMSELTKEISKLIRGKYNVDNMCEEIGHVMFSLEKLIYALDVKESVGINLYKTWERAETIFLQNGGKL